MLIGARHDETGEALTGKFGSKEREAGGADRGVSDFIEGLEHGATLGRRRQKGQWHLSGNPRRTGLREWNGRGNLTTAIPLTLSLSTRGEGQGEG